jgi:hypothetical protein
MSQPDSSAVDAALMVLLGADAALLALCPNGVYWDEAPAGAKRFVIVSLADEADVAEFQRTAFEDALYLVKAVMLDGTSGNIRAAAARIHQLLQDTNALEVAGYGIMAIYRESRVRQTEVDGVDPMVRWQHRGGRYRVQAATA